MTSTGVDQRAYQMVMRKGDPSYAVAPRRALFGEGGTEVAVFFEITRPGHAPLPSSLFAVQPLRPKRDASAVAALLPERRDSR